jgi:hypothetical protein
MSPTVFTFTLWLPPHHITHQYPYLMFPPFFPSFFRPAQEVGTHMIYFHVSFGFGRDAACDKAPFGLEMK